jgi:hypothetical protein
VNLGAVVKAARAVNAVVVAGVIVNANRALIVRKAMN